MQKLTDERIKALQLVLPEARRDELMSAHTSMKIGGPARLYLIVSTRADLLNAIEAAKSHKISFYVFGGGSNMLVSDDGYEGIMLQFADRSYKIDGTSIRAAGGALTGVVARAAAEAGLTGFEWGAGIPGTIGGATYGNSGSFGWEMKDAVANVEALKISTNAIINYSNAECRFGYRDSRFKRDPHVILSTTLELRTGDREGALKKVAEIMEKRKASQPQGYFSAGCLFKNFEYEDESALEKLQTQVEEIPEAMLKQKRISAGWLIDLLGLKGTKIGNAQISPIHGNFLVNLGNARAQDAMALSSLVKMKIRDELGIMLEDEVQLVGW
ncbi:UDP-N-acetylmuramate dehydrogenase [Patescibacteria group bacterium]|nr:UDP-N-acetylmuramate dehydrogenase [Patescibacteria group bacterium]MBU1035006.1 UDP-N-acetylmuramate dehydrogenase [Patescibacteria group bacterium]MBU1629900.1 UDP-N-acetylmuramate dehydrogenase [Patescibacteria group bacterium]MBU1908291.1 UDP-N-acetylmuramate dehydrogenase [Patescibacteria group bacterium]